MIDFGDDFAFLEREMYADFEGLSGDRSTRAVAAFETRLDELIRDKFQGVKSIGEKRRISGGYLTQISDRSFKDITSTELNELKEVPDMVWSSLQSYALLAPNKVPREIINEVNSRRKSIKMLSDQIGQIKSKKQSDLTEEEVSHLQSLMLKLRQESTNFTLGLDPKVLIAAKAVYNTSLFRDQSYRDMGSTNSSLSDWVKDLADTGANAFDFFRTGTGLPALVSDILHKSSKLYEDKLGNIARDIRSGKISSDPQFQKNFRSSKFRIPKSLTADKFTSAISNVTVGVFNHLAKFSGPYGAVLLILAKLAQYMIAQRQQQIAFNRSIIDLFGSINQLSSFNPKVPSTEKQLTAFYQTIYDYFNDRSPTYKVIRPDGSSFIQKGLSLELNLDAEKYVTLLDPLIKSGATLRDIEADFGRVALKPNMLGDVRTDQIANLKGPLEDFFAISQVFQSDPSVLGQALGNWRFSYGDLISEQNHSLRTLAHIVSASPVSPKVFLKNVLDLSDSFGYFSNRSLKLGQVLNALVRKRVLSADQGRELLSNVLQEVLGYNTSQIMGILGPLLSENPKSVAKFLGAAASQVRNQIKLEIIKERRASTLADRNAAQAKLVQLRGLLAYLQTARKSVSSGKHNLTELSGATATILKFFPDLSFNLLDDAVSARFRTISGRRLKDQNPGLSDVTQVDQATNTLGLGPGIAEFVASQRYSSKYRSKGLPKPVTPEQLQELILNAAVNLTFKTTQASEVLDKTLKAIGAKVQSTFRQLYEVGMKFYNFLTNSQNSPIPEQPSTPSTAPSINFPQSQVIDYRSRVPRHKIGRHNQGNVQKIRKLVLHSTEGSASSAVNEFTSGPRQASAHYIVDRDGKIYYMVDEKKTALHGGAIGPDSPLVGKGFKTGQSINPFALGIEIEHQGDQKYTDVQYMTVARMVASIMQRYGLSLEDVISHEEVARGRERVHGPSGHPLGEVRTDPVGFDWGRLRGLVRSMMLTPQVPAEGDASRRSVKAYKDTIQQDTYLQQLFHKAYSTQSNIHTNMSYGDFIKRSKNFLAKYDLATLREVIRNNGSERRNLILEYFRNFSIEINPQIIVGLVKGYVSAEEARVSYIKASAQRQRLRTQVQDLARAAQTAQRNQKEQVQHQQIVGLDSEFRQKFADNLSKLADGKSILIEQYTVDVYLKDSTKFIDYIQTNYQPTLEKGVSYGGQ